MKVSALPRNSHKGSTADARVAVEAAAAADITGGTRPRSSSRSGVLWQQQGRRPLAPRHAKTVVAAAAGAAQVSLLSDAEPLEAGETLLLVCGRVVLACRPGAAKQAAAAG